MRRGNEDNFAASDDAQSDFENFFGYFKKYEIPENPEDFARRLLELGGYFATETHYSAHKKGGLTLSAGLHFAERLRYPSAGAIGGFAILIAVNWYQPFFIDSSTGDGAERQGYYNLIMFAMGTMIASMVGDTVHTKVGHEAYHDPRHFKNYFENLASILTPTDPSFMSRINPDPNDPHQSRHFFKFHFKVHHHLLRKDPRAAAYMLTSLTRDFPYFNTPIYVPAVIARSSSTAAAAISATAAPEHDSNMRRVFKRRLGLADDATDDLLNACIQEIIERTNRIMDGDANENDTPRGKLQRRLNAFKDRLSGLINEHFKTEQRAVLNDLVNAEVDGNINAAFVNVLTGERSIDSLNFTELFSPILRVLQNGVDDHFRQRTDQEISDNISFATLKRYARNNIESVLQYWQTSFSQFIRLTGHREQAHASDLRSRGMTEFIAAPGTGVEVRGLQEELLRNRDTMAQNNARRLAALNQAMAELGIDLILDPMSAAIFDGVLQDTHSVEARGFAPDSEVLADSLDLALLTGQNRARLPFVVKKKLMHASFDIDGFLNPAIKNDSLPQVVRLALQDQRRCAARNGWLYHESEVNPRDLPQEAKTLREKYPGWILPAKDDPTYFDKIELGHISVECAKQTYREIFGGARLKKDEERIKDLALILRRFVGHVNPLVLHKPGRELETQLRDRAHVLAHLLHEDGHYKHWEHWIAHSEIRTSAFMRLTLEQQVWLIFELMSGPDYAKLVGLSILQDPTFVNTPNAYNNFMREYIKFMQAHLKDKSQPQDVIEMRQMLFLEQLTLITEMSAGRVINPQTGQASEKGLMARFLNDHTRKSGIIFNALVGTLSSDRAAYHLNQIKPYLSRYDVLSSDSDRLGMLLEYADYFKQILSGTSANRDASDLLRGGDNVDKAAIAERFFIRKNVFHLRWLIAYYQARMRAGDLYRCISTNPEKQELAHDLMHQCPEIIMLTLPLEDQNLEHIKQLLMSANLGEISNDLRKYIWHVLARLIHSDYENNKTYVINFLAENVTHLLTPDAIKDSLDDILQPDAVSDDIRHKLIYLALFAVHEKPDYVKALYAELTRLKPQSLFQFYKNIYDSTPDTLGVPTGFLSSTMQVFVNELQENLADDADVIAVCRLLTGVDDLDEMRPYLENYSDVRQFLVRAWLRADKPRGDPPLYLAHNFIIDQLRDNFKNYHFALAADFVKINLEFSPPRFDLIHQALVALAQSCSALPEGNVNRIVGDRVTCAKALFLLRKNGLITEEQKRQLVDGLIGEHAEYIWIYVNDSYPVPDQVASPDSAPLLTAADRSRIRYAAQRIVTLLANECSRSQDVTTLAEAAQFALSRLNSINYMNTSDRFFLFLRSAMLEYCLERPDQDSHFLTLVFNHIMRVLHERFVVSDATYWIEKEGESHPPQLWLQRLFFSYIKRYYANDEANAIINAFTNPQASMNYAIYWQRFREAYLNLHYSWDVWRGDREQRDFAFSHILTMIKRGFSAANGLLQDEQRKMAIRDAWYLLLQHLKVDVALEPAGLSAPKMAQCSVQQYSDLIEQLYAFPNLPETGIDGLPVECNTCTGLVARLAYAFLSPTSLSQVEFHNFATQLFPTIMRNLRGVAFDYADDHELITRLCDQLPAAIKNNGDAFSRVKQRLVLAYAYWKWHNSYSRSWISLLAHGFSRQREHNTCAIHIQDMLQVLQINTRGEDPTDQQPRRAVDQIYNDNFFNQLNIAGTAFSSAYIYTGFLRSLNIASTAFPAWFKERINQNAGARDQQENSESELTRLLPNADELRRAEEGLRPDSAEDPPPNCSIC